MSWPTSSVSLVGDSSEIDNDVSRGDKLGYFVGSGVSSSLPFVMDSTVLPALHSLAVLDLNFDTTCSSSSVTG